MGQARRRTTSAEMERRRARAIELLSLGRTFEQIADEFGYKSKTSARHLVDTALKANTAHNVEELRTKERLQLDAMEATLLPMVVGRDLAMMTDKERYTVYEAADRIVKIKERRAKMFGLDHSPDMQLTNNGQIQVVLDGRVMDKTRSAVEVEVPADEEGK